MPDRPSVAAGQAEETGDNARELGWFYTAEFSFVLAAGNAETSTIGLGAGLRREWEKARLRLEAGGLRTKSTTTTRRAIGTPDEFELLENSESNLTAENYRIRARFDRSLSERAFAYAGAGWNRNTFAGFDNRWSFAGGGGIIWAEGERQSFRTDIAATFTLQNDIVRADFLNSIVVSISDAVALRTSVQLLFDNLPSLSLTGLAHLPGGRQSRERAFAISPVASRPALPRTESLRPFGDPRWPSTSCRPTDTTGFRWPDRR